MVTARPILTAGAGLTLTGRTLDVVANADASIVVAANDVKVGVLATDAQHGVRGGGTQHAAATSAAAGFMSAADKAKSDLSITTAAMTLYVNASTGNDANAGTVGAPVATIQAAIDLIPRSINHPVTVNVAAGTYAAGAFIGGRTFLLGADAAVGAYIQVLGAFTAVTPTTGTASGTATSITAGSGLTRSVITDSGQTWTVSDLKGKLIDLGAFGMFEIEDNTATAATISFVVPGLTGLPAYSIKEPASVVTGPITGASTTTYPIPVVNQTAASTGGINSRLFSATSFIIDNRPGPYREQQMQIRGFKFTGSSAGAVRMSSPALIAHNRFEQTTLNAVFITTATHLIFIHNSGSPGAGTNLVEVNQTACPNSWVTISGNVYTSGASILVGAGALGKFVCSYNSLSGFLATALYRMGGFLEGEIILEHYTGCTGQVMTASQGLFGSSTGGVLLVDGCVINSCSTIAGGVPLFTIPSGTIIFDRTFASSGTNAAQSVVSAGPNVRVQVPTVFALGATAGQTFSIGSSVNTCYKTIADVNAADEKTIIGLTDQVLTLG